MKFKSASLLWLICLIHVFQINAQKTLTLEDIYQKSTFSAKGLYGLDYRNDGATFTKIEGNTIVKYNLKTGENIGVLFDGNMLKSQAGFDGSVDGYEFSSDEKKILIASEEEAIYRHSTKAFYYIYDMDTKSLTKVFEQGKIMYADLNNDNSKVAFVYENNMYYKDLGNIKTIQITKDGAKNKIINGSPDWVYEEEFSFSKAFAWSPEGDRIAFMRFDETEVPEFTMQLYNDDLYPIQETFKYPKVGEKNAKVTVHIFDTKKGKTADAKIEQSEDTYIPRIKWTTDNDDLAVITLNRHQNHLKLLEVNAKNGKVKTIMEETNKYYIDITDDLTFLKDGKHFIWSSEKEGYNQLYLYNRKGEQQKKLTQGNFDVLSMYGIDEKRKRIYYSAAEKNPMNHSTYSIDYDGKNKKEITPFDGVNKTIFTKTFDYYINQNSTANTPNTFKVYEHDGKLVRVIYDNEHLTTLQREYNAQEVTFFQFTTSEKVTLNGWMIKPPNFDATKKYPVFMTQYSGPGSQQVVNKWGSTSYWWHQLLSQKGYIIVCVDPRGTGARGEEFKKMTYLNLGKYETKDQIEAAKYVGALPFVDNKRIGIFGWSYGGYMSSLCILKGNDVFKAAIAIAPVTSWKWYDSIYTERYMRTLAENEAGYKENSPVYFADQLKGNFFFAHGLADDNVHFQNSAELANALIRANKQFDTYYYPNRNHGIYGNNATIHLYTKMTNFILEKL